MPLLILAKIKLPHVQNGQWVCRLPTLHNLLGPNLSIKKATSVLAWLVLDLATMEEILNHLGRLKPYK